MSMFKMIGRVFLYLFIAVVVFLTFVNFIQFPNTSETTNKTTLQEKVMKIENNREVKVLNEMNPNKKWDSSLVIEWKKEFLFLEYISKEKSQVLPMIYLLIMLTFLIQSMLLALSNYYTSLVHYLGEKKVDNLFMYMSEWTVNSPPVLGVVGTIFSFGIVVSNMSDISALTTLFKENFADAALTTIIGGMVYVFNLFLNIFIVKNLSIENS